MNKAKSLSSIVTLGRGHSDRKPGSQAYRLKKSKAGSSRQRVE